LSLGTQGVCRSGVLWFESRFDDCGWGGSADQPVVQETVSHRRDVRA